MLPDVLLRFWDELEVTSVGEIVNFALLVWLDSHSWSPGTTPVAWALLVEMRRWNVLPAAIGPKKSPPLPSPESLTHTAMPLL
jgi:hypothetical protein